MFKIVARASKPRIRARFVAAVALGVALSAAAVDIASAAGPFRPFSGSWRGAGRITSSDGRSEPITCRATYDVGEGDRSLTQSLVCASESFRVNIEIDAAAEGRSIQGQWRETTRNVEGSLTGEIAQGDLEGEVSGAGFTAQFSIRVTGRRQAVRFQPSAGDIHSVDIVLTKQK